MLVEKPDSVEHLILEIKDAPVGRPTEPLQSTPPLRPKSCNRNLSPQGFRDPIISSAWTPKRARMASRASLMRGMKELHVNYEKPFVEENGNFFTRYDEMIAS